MISYLCHSFFENGFLWSLSGTQGQVLTYFLIKCSDLVGLDWYSEISIFSSSPQPLCHVVKDLTFRNTALWGGILSFETAQMFQLLSTSSHCNLVRHAYPQPREKFRNRGLGRALHLFKSVFSWSSLNQMANGRAWPSWRNPLAPSKSIRFTGFDIFATKDFICSQYSWVITSESLNTRVCLGKTLLFVLQSLSQLSLCMGAYTGTGDSVFEK